MEELRAEWFSVVERGQNYPPGHPLRLMSESVAKGGPPPQNRRDTPLIIDTDIAGDGDDALAVTAAVRSVPKLALVITCDETGPVLGYGQRARFARWLLDALGRPELPVVAGASTGDTRYFCCEGMVPDSVAPQPDDVVAAVRAVCAAAEGGPVRWVGMGSLSNLARVVEEAPELAPQLRVTQMGGALNYRRPDRAEHNIRMDVAAARTVLKAVEDGRLSTPEFVISDTTFTPLIEVTAESPIYRALSAPDAPEWARILTAHLDNWFARFHPGTMQHDALTLSAALDHTFVRFTRHLVALDGIGRMSEVAQGGAKLKMSNSATYELFMDWLAARLDPAYSPSESSRTRPEA